MNSGSERVGGFVRDLGDAARSNPISAALIGMGAVWLFASRSQRGEELIKRSGIDRLPEAARDAWAGASSSIRETADAATDTVRRHGDRAADQITESGKRLLQSASESMDDLPDRAADLLDDARDNLTELFKSQPLAIGAVGLALGAAIAAAFPTTETEAEYLGESSEFIKQKAGELAGEQVERAAEVGTKVVDAVVDEARQQGLTVDGLKAAATELSDKAARVADAATRSSPT
jgi:hypothetical protein